MSDPMQPDPTPPRPPDTPVPAPDAPAPAPEDREALEAKVRDQQAELEALRAKVQPASRPPGEKVDREVYADWPQEGGIDAPQPWDLRGQGLALEAQALVETPGAPNTVAPIVVRHAYPILTTGTSDPSVQELGRRLGELGFENSVTRGENPWSAVDTSVMQAVHAFRAAYGVVEDPGPYGGDTPAGRALSSNHVGPWTWEAVLRASERVREAQAV